MGKLGLRVVQPTLGWLRTASFVVSALLAGCAGTPAPAPPTSGGSSAPTSGTPANEVVVPAEGGSFVFRDARTVPSVAVHELHGHITNRTNLHWRTAEFEDATL